MSALTAARHGPGAAPRAGAGGLPAPAGVSAPGAHRSPYRSTWITRMLRADCGR
jgi:hypothetical protein